MRRSESRSCPNAAVAPKNIVTRETTVAVMPAAGRLAFCSISCTVFAPSSPTVAWSWSTIALSASCGP